MFYIDGFILLILALYYGYLFYCGGLQRFIAYYGVSALVGTVLILVGQYFWTGLYPSLSIYSLVVPIVLVVGYSLIKRWNKNTTFGDAHFMNAWEMHKAGLFKSYNNESIKLGKAYGKTLEVGGFESMLLVAPTGSGKTRSIAYPNVMQWNGSLVVNDLKGELYQMCAKHRADHWGDEVILWAPADPNANSAHYNPFYYVSDDPNLRIRDIQLIAEVLIPENKLGDGFWYQSSREIFLMLALYLFEAEGMATLGDVYDLSKSEDLEVWLEDLLDKRSSKHSKQFFQYANAFNSTEDRTRSNILKDFHSRMNVFSDPLVQASTENNDFDFRYIRQQRMGIFIQISNADKERLKPLLTLFWSQLVNHLSAHEPDIKEEPYGVLAVLDEFGNMAKINQLKEGMSFLRSYRMRCIVIVQYLSQIYSVYGQHDAKGFLNAKIKMCFALNDMSDAQFFSKVLGDKSIKVSSHSQTHGDGKSSASRNCSYQGKPLCSESKIFQLRKDKQIILLESLLPMRVKKLSNPSGS